MAGAALLIGGTVGLGLPAAAAEPSAPGVRAASTDPLALTSAVTDEAGVLSASDITAIRNATGALANRTRYRLYVVYVPSFGDADALTWAQQTAERTGLGQDDFLLAVATDQHSYVLSPRSAPGLSGSAVEHVAAQVEVTLRAAKSDGDWAAAGVTAADDLATAATHRSVPWPMLVGVGVLIVAISSVSRVLRVRRRARYLTTVLAGTGQAGAPPVGPLLAELAPAVSALVGPAPVAPPGSWSPTVPTQCSGSPVSGSAPGAQTSTDELTRQASAALVSADDAVRSSEQELGLAAGEFGEAATQPFADVLTAVRQLLAEAFRLRQTLDDQVPDTEQEVRAASTRILALCRQAHDELDAQKQGFDRLRNLEEHVEDVLAATGRTCASVRDRVEPATVVLADLATRYPPAALASVQGNPEHAANLLDDVARTVATGQAALAAGDRPHAAGCAQTAAAALAQAGTLLDAVDSAGTDLAAAGTRLSAAIASLTADLADASRLAPADPGVAAEAAAAGAAVTAAQRTLGAGGDPLAALAGIGAAQVALVRALAPYRETPEQVDRLRGQVDDILHRLTGQVGAVDTYVATRRGAVGPLARTRLAEADRLARQADVRKTSDPAGALGDAQQAEVLAQQAMAAAHADVGDVWAAQPSAGTGVDPRSPVFGGLLLAGLAGLGGGLRVRVGGGSGNGWYRSSGWGGGSGSGWGGGGSGWDGGGGGGGDSDRGGFGGSF